MSCGVQTGRCGFDLFFQAVESIVIDLFSVICSGFACSLEGRFVFFRSDPVWLKMRSAQFGIIWIRGFGSDLAEREVLRAKEEKNIGLVD
jgi:hypothetical protein